MSTRCYLYNDSVSVGSNDTMEVTPSDWSAGWNSTGAAINKHLLPYRAPEDGGTHNASFSGTAGHYTAALRFVSPALEAQTITGTIKGMLALAKQDTVTEATVAIGVKVITSAGADRGILLAVTAADAVTTTPPNLTNSPTTTSRKFMDASENDEITLGSVAAQRGDRLVVEVGTRQDNTEGGFFVTGIKTDAVGDFAAEAVAFLDGNPWVEFSADLIFVPIFFGSSSTPTDGAAAVNTADPTFVSPPVDTKAGDLVLMIGHQRATGATIAVSAASGQTWNSEAAIGTTLVTARLFWCVFNGTWTGDPSVDFSAAVCNSVQMLVFRGTKRFTHPGLYTWIVNQAQVELDIAGSPAAITGQTTTGTDPTVTVAGWFSADDNTWGSISGTGWVVAGDAQYRNTSGSDQSSSYAYKIQTAPAATGNVTKTQTANGPDASTSFIITFAEVPWRFQGDAVNRSYAVNRAALH